MAGLYKYHKGPFPLFVMAFILMIQVPSSLTISLAEENRCPHDRALIDSGWIVHHSEEFSSISQDIMMAFKKNKNEYVYDTEGLICSGPTLKMLKYVSYDNKATRQAEMYGDIVLIKDCETGKLVELRWYEGRKRHVVYDGASRSCACNLLPVVKNCLF